MFNLEELDSNKSKTIFIKNKDLLLNKKNKVYVVLKGQSNIFISEIEEGIPVKREFLFSVKQNDLLFNLFFELGDRKFSLLSSGSSDLILLELEFNYFFDLCTLPFNIQKASEAIENWVKSIYSFVKVEFIPDSYVVLSSNTSIHIDSGSLFSSEYENKISWVFNNLHDSMFFLYDDVPIGVEDSCYFPLLRGYWLLSYTDCELSYIDTFDLINSKCFKNTILNFNFSIMNMCVNTFEKKHQSDFYNVRHRISQDLELNDLTTDEFLSLFNKKKSSEAKTSKNSIYSACSELFKNMNLEIPKPEDLDLSLNTKQIIKKIAELSNSKYRKVVLTGEWWKKDNGHLLCFEYDTFTPKALIYNHRNYYTLYDPVSNTYKKVDFATSQTINPFSLMFYKPLNLEHHKLKDSFKDFFFKLPREDVLSIFSVFLFSSLISMIYPVVTGSIFDSVIPKGVKSTLLQLTILLLSTVISLTVFSIVKYYSVLRLSIKSNLYLQSALWSHVLNLPTDFFKNYTSGELSSKCMGIDKIYSLFPTGSAIFFISSIFSFFSLFVMFYYNFQMSTFILAFVLLYTFFFYSFSKKLIESKKKLIDQRDKLSGLVVQIIKAVDKIKVTASESRIFWLWSSKYKSKKQIEFSVNNQSLFLSLLTSFLFPTCLLISFYTYFKFNLKTISLGEFLAFNTAMSGFVISISNVLNLFLSSIECIPIYNSLKKIILCDPEEKSYSEDAGTFNGNIEIKNLHFKYSDSEDYVLNDVSLNISSGEYVAIVGPSGSGKSTLLRLLLGFESPNLGQIFYDNKDFSKLNLKSVRSQLGVVLQDSKLISGNLLSNITGYNSSFTEEDAWKIAKITGVDKDINDMPMKMHTLVSEGMSTLSGGQRQKILISRALIHNPKIIYFDEATSALDNVSQKVVTTSLNQLSCTRVIIAHRLSTIKDCDKIFVLDSGKLVESGSYEELIKNKKLFYELAKRQMTSFEL